MNEAYSQVEQLVESSLQIMDHMEVDEGTEEQLHEIKLMLQHVHDELDYISSEPNESYDKIMELQQHVYNTGQLLEPLTADLAKVYSQETNGSPQSFEKQSLTEQVDDVQGYHGKIDFKSAKKLQENLEKIDNELRSFH